jgi:hypothetical protein
MVSEIKIDLNIDQEALIKLKKWGWKHKLRPEAISELTIILGGVIKANGKHIN